MKKSYEEEIQDIFKIAEDNFGSEYFKQLDKLSRDYSSNEQESQNYSLIVNHKGAFYACEDRYSK